MAAVVSLTRMERRRPAQEDICPLESKSLRADGEDRQEEDRQEEDRQEEDRQEEDRQEEDRQEEDRQEEDRQEEDRQEEDRQEEERTAVSGDITVTGQHFGANKVWLNSAVDVATSEASEDELGRLDIDLDRKSKQHNLTSSNVRAILHEVITHEHVVAMMKAAIRDTQDLPMFEPKMTRSRLKQAIQQGQPLNWSLSAVNTAKPPQFVDIDLEEDEDSSDEEYCPEEEEEEEDTAEETFLSDADSLASPPKMHQDSHPRVWADQRTDDPLQRPPGQLGDPLTCTPHHLLPPPESSFLERLNAVDEELDSSAVYTYNQSLDRKADDAADDDDGGGGDEGSSCLAFRTRSKRPLVNVPLGQLEAELLAPDITEDMYEQSAAQRKQDRHWTKWLQGLMAPDTDEEADDEDDPEYNFLEDVDEPDLEDYRTDRGVQITKKEVNQLLEELFDTLQEEEEEHEEEEPSQTGPKFNVPQALRFDAPLASMLTERRRTVRKQYEAAQQRRALQDTTNHHRDNKEAAGPAPDPVPSVLVLPGRVEPPLHLNSPQKLQLQQQIQQVQPATLTLVVCVLQEELQQFSSRREQVLLPSSFRVCNLRGALDLLQEVEQRAEPPVTPLPVPAAASRRLLPSMTPATNSHAFPLLPAEDAWLFATRPVFLYPELLPVCSLDPPAHSQRPRSIYTAGEDGLIVLALKHFAETLQPDQLISCYLVCKSRWNFRKHVRDMSGPRAPSSSVIKMFVTQRVVPPLPLACSRVDPGEQRPPVDRNTPNTPNWLKNSQLIIQKSRLSSGHYPPSLPPGITLRLHPYWLSKSSHPPPPSHRRIFALAHNASLPPLAQRPADRQSDRPEDSLLDRQASRKSKRRTDRWLDRKINQPMDRQPINTLSLPPPGVTLLSDSAVSTALSPPLAVSGALAPPPVCGAVSLAAVHPGPAHILQPCLPIGQWTQQQQSSRASLPLPSLTDARTNVTPAYFLLQMVWTPAATSQHALGQQLHRPIKEEREDTTPRLPLEEERREEEESSGSSSTLSPMSSCEEGEEGREGGEEENWADLGVLNGVQNTGGEEEEGREGGREEEEGAGGGGGEGDEDQDRQGEEEEEEEEDFDDLTQDEDEEEVMSSASEESVLSVPELQETMKQLTWLAAERRLCTDGDSEEDHSPTSQEEEEEEEEEGPKGEESGEGGGSKEGGEEEGGDEETPAGEETTRGGAGGRCLGRGRGRSRPLRGLRRGRQQRHSKDAAKLLQLYDDNIVNNDPQRESKDLAFAQSYLHRVHEVDFGVWCAEVDFGYGNLCPVLCSGAGVDFGYGNLCPGVFQVREVDFGIWCVKIDFGYGNLCPGVFQVHEVDFGYGNLCPVVVQVREVDFGVHEVDFGYGNLCPVCLQVHEVDFGYGNLCPGGLQVREVDFGMWKHMFTDGSQQVLQCGLFEEQQAFERSRRFLRQLEISFGDNPSHYQKIIKALQTGPDLSPNSIAELKAQMSALLKGHTHLQTEFWVFFDELRPPPARPGQFEEAHWPEDGGGGSDGGEGGGLVLGGGASCGFEEVTLPELEEEEEGLKIQPMASRRQRRKMDAHRNYKDCDWSDEAKISRHRRKGCSHCHGNKTSGGVSRAMKSLDPLYSQISSAHKDLDLKGDHSPQPADAPAAHPSETPPLLCSFWMQKTSCHSYLFTNRQQHLLHSNITLRGGYPHALPETRRWRLKGRHSSRKKTPIPQQTLHKKGLRNLPDHAPKRQTEDSQNIRKQKQLETPLAPPPPPLTLTGNGEERRGEGRRGEDR
ncbi:GON-4-like protein [Perca fluviatilis]|uniref:GON-4-like protein n=1 Tax=Perca fluviatilis TaxID=8168 RepID=UPI0019644808|nr:GON-4-like protein [Perca fluviatilis]